MNNKSPIKKKLLPIVVDLDGTLVLTDTLFETLVKIFHKLPSEMLNLPFWLARGKANLKKNLSEKIALNPETLPYNKELLEWLKKNKALGHQLILCTAADKKIANTIADYIKLFDEVIASDGLTNMGGANKRDELVRRYGERGFIYAGNAKPDIEVWRSSAQAVVVNGTDELAKRASELTEVIQIIPSEAITFNSWFRVLRIHQYLKNLLLFVPLIAAHQINQPESLRLLMLAFVSFSLCASSVYIVNDLIDLESDRLHPNKHRRPFSSGLIPITYGLILAPILLIVSFVLAGFMESHFFKCLSIYFILSSAYSLRLKRYALIDCFMLAALYTLRVVAGAIVIDVPLSFWLIAFSVFFFLSLAFVKRYAEMSTQISHGKENLHGRGYYVNDALLIQGLGITSGFASVLVLALYLNSEAVVRLYAAPQIMWLAIPLLLFWISWIWMKAHRGEMHDDPIIFAIKDKISRAIGVFLFLIFIGASTWTAF